MIQNEQELRFSYITIAKLYGTREKCAKETLWDPETRDDIVEGIDSQIEKIEREIKQYIRAEPAMEIVEDKAA